MCHYHLPSTPYLFQVTLRDPLEKRLSCPDPNTILRVNTMKIALWGILALAN